MAQILIVEDDRSLAEMVVDWLTNERHDVEHLPEGSEAVERIAFGHFDVVLLDWELPGCSGFDVLSAIRARGLTVPIIMMTGKGAIDDKEQALDSGADDYLTKPFNLRELSSRIRVCLRHSAGTATNTLAARTITLDPKSHKVLKSGVTVELQKSEFALLEFLMRHPRQVFSTSALLERVWGAETESGDEAIHSCVKRLRKKLADGEESALIVTVRGEGYMLDA
jgi:DNA-binding response OmpR family regulator